MLPPKKKHTHLPPKKRPQKWKKEEERTSQLFCHPRQSPKTNLTSKIAAALTFVPKLGLSKMKMVVESFEGTFLKNRCVL
jgi:hypothetical protein